MIDWGSVLCYPLDSVCEDYVISVEVIDEPA
jgi:hypothetical protein